jgi:hypothetical protein
MTGKYRVQIKEVSSLVSNQAKDELMKKPQKPPYPIKHSDEPFRIRLRLGRHSIVGTVPTRVDFSIKVGNLPVEIEHVPEQHYQKDRIGHT